MKSAFQIDNTTFDLADFPKFMLEELFKSCGQKGDTARISKADLFSRIVSLDEQTITDGLQIMIDNGDLELEEQSSSIPAPKPKAPKAAKPEPVAQPEPAPKATPKPEPVAAPVAKVEQATTQAIAKVSTPSDNGKAVQEFVEAFSKLYKPSLDSEQIAKLVRDEVKAAFVASPTKTQTIVVSPAATIDLGEEHLHPQFESIVKLAGIRQSVLMVGAAGTGKTHAAAQVARALNLEFASISCSAGMSESHLLGYLLPGAGGEFKYEPSDFVRLYENGGVFNLDEIDAADGNVLTVINSALANDSFHVPQRRGNTLVKRHPDFVCLAAANTFGTGADMVYAGRERLDGATLDRFTQVVMEYDVGLEHKLCDAKVLEWGHVVRARVSDNKLRRIVSTRKLIAMTQQIAAGFTFKQAKTMFFNGWSKDELSKVGE